MTDTGDFAATTYGIQGPFGFGDDGLGFKVWFHSMTQGHRLRWNPASTGKLDGIGSATIELDTVSFNTISEMTAGSGVTIDGVLLKDGTVALDSVAFDIITEKTAGSGVTIDGVKLKDSEPYCDVINEKTAAAGVTVDGVLLKDNSISLSGTVDGVDVSARDHNAVTVAAAPLTLSTQQVTFNYDTNDFQLNGNNLQVKDSGVDHGGIGGLADVADHAGYLLLTGARAGSTSEAQDFGSTGIKGDAIAESTAAAGVTVDGVLLKDSEVTTDTINEKTGAAGVTIDTVLVKDDIVECSKYQLNDDNTTITETSSNLSFKDAVAPLGTYTLEQLAERGGVRISTDYASGSTTAGIQQAADDLTAGGMVYIPAGTHTLSAAVALSSKTNIHIVGAGISTIVTLANTTNTDVFTLSSCTDCSVENLQINGNRDNQTSNGTGVSLTDCIRCSAKNLKISETDEHGLEIYESALGLSTDNELSGNYINNVDAKGIHVYSNVLWPNRRTLIKNNTLRDTFGDEAMQALMSDSRVEGNDFDSSGNITLTIANGGNNVICNNRLINRGAGTSKPLEFGSDTPNCVVSGNIIKTLRDATTARGIVQANPPTVGQQGLTITGNHFQCTKEAIYARQVCTITGNTFRRGVYYTASSIAFAATTPGTITDATGGLAAFQTGMSIVVTGTDSNNGTYTVSTGGVAGTIRTTEATLLEAAGAGTISGDYGNTDAWIDLSQVGHTTVTGNQFDGRNSTGAYKMVDLIASDYNVVVGNTFMGGSGAETAIGVTTGVSNVVRPNTFMNIATEVQTPAGALFGLSAEEKIQFRDPQIYIHSANDGYLDLEADTEIRLGANATVGVTSGAKLGVDSTAGSPGLSIYEGGTFRYAFYYDITNNWCGIYTHDDGVSGADVIRIPDGQPTVDGNATFDANAFDWVCDTCGWHSESRQEKCPQCGGEVAWQDDGMLMNAVVGAPGKVRDMPKELLLKLERLGIINTYGTAEGPLEKREVFVSMNKAHWFSWSAIAQLWRRNQELEARLVALEA